MIILFTNKKNANKSELTKEKNCQVRSKWFYRGRHTMHIANNKM